MRVKMNDGESTLVLFEVNKIKLNNNIYDAISFDDNNGNHYDIRYINYRDARNAFDKAVETGLLNLTDNIEYSFNIIKY